MAASGDVTVAQDGGQGSVKLHPYLVTLVRWCVSCLWSTATVFLHRLVTTPLQPITGPKPATARSKVPKRVAGTEHLHPEPKVECQLLHQPANHTMDVIFVHGLYGSLGNTWRQGDWRQKYIADPKIVTLRDHSKANTCNCRENSFKNHEINNSISTESNITEDSLKDKENKNAESNVTDLSESDISIKKINEKLSKKVIPQENDLITEQFYNNTLMDQEDVVQNYDTQANFVSDIFKRETDCDKTCDKNSFNFNKDDSGFISDQNVENDSKYKYNEDITLNYSESNNFKYNADSDNNFKYDQNSDNNYKCDQNSDNEFKCKYNEINDFNECKCGSEEKNCEVGCGCVCNDCYSTCWPRDWIKMDFPGARVISINYTSDPYLWRPLWIKENKRLNLYQRAEQMMEQLLDMGVGEKPIIWVGHSKGGLFIKQIYCEAYEAYKKTNKNYKVNNETKEVICNKTKEALKETRNGITAENIDTIIGHFSHDKEELYSESNNNCNSETNDKNSKDIYLKTSDNNDFKYRSNDNSKTNDSYPRTCDSVQRKQLNDNYLRTINSITNNNECAMKETVEYENVFEQINADKDNDNLQYANILKDNMCNMIIENGNETNCEIFEAIDLRNGERNEDLTSSIEDSWSSRRASLWSSSRGFMFYSVPHRGSPLADIKTPVTARSVDLLEIAKDCPLVLELQHRWQQAVSSTVSVRSVVETTRTLMSVLWLRIVSTESADAGIGILSGISVDHREICKPTSRSCRLYTMLTDLIHVATTCKCR